MHSLIAKLSSAFTMQSEMMRVTPAAISMPRDSIATMQECQLTFHIDGDVISPMPYGSTATKKIVAGYMAYITSTKGYTNKRARIQFVDSPGGFVVTRPDGTEHEDGSLVVLAVDSKWAASVGHDVEELVDILKRCDKIWPNAQYLGSCEIGDETALSIYPALYKMWTSQNVSYARNTFGIILWLHGDMSRNPE